MKQAPLVLSVEIYWRVVYSQPKGAKIGHCRILAFDQIHVNVIGILAVFMAEVQEPLLPGAMASRIEYVEL